MLLPNPGVPGTMLIPLTKGLFAVIDEVDAAAVGKYDWSARMSRKTSYAARLFGGRDNRGTEYLHQLIWRLAGGEETPEVDHRDGDGLNCRRGNLRAATRTQNNANRSVSSNNACRVRGVHWSKAQRCWRAQITSNGKRISLGSFAELAEARSAYERAAREHFGEFARAS